MWVRVVTSADIGGDQIVLSGATRDEVASESVTVRYGALETGAMLVPFSEADAQGVGETRDRPAELLVGKDLAERLWLRTEPVYRMHRSGDLLEIGPVTGLWVSRWNYRRIRRREPNRVASVYAQTGGLFCLFHFRGIFAGQQRILGRFYDPESHTWRRGVVPLPATVYRRVFSKIRRGVDLTRLLPGVKVFNAHRYHKAEIHELGLRDDQVIPHLPDTIRLLQGTDVLSMVARHKHVVLKPEHLSRGRGIRFLGKNADGSFFIRNSRGAAQGTTAMTQSELISYVRNRLVGRRYLCQQRIQLAEVDGAPYDVRVIMQRGLKGAWQCSGMVCRLAGSGNLVTNVSQGGQGLGLEEALSRSFPDGIDTAAVRARLLQLAESVCRMLDRTGWHYGELGLDLAVDRAGDLWLIEVNVLPAFQAFKRLDPDLHWQIRLTPWFYATAIAGFPAEPSAEE